MKWRLKRALKFMFWTGIIVFLLTLAIQARIIFDNYYGS